MRKGTRGKRAAPRSKISGLELCVYVKYPSMSVKWLMGKIISIERGGARILIFYHESTDSQHLRILDSPGGVDQCLLGLLKSYNVVEYHHYHKGSSTLYCVAVGTIESKGILQSLGGKTRYFLPESLWLKCSSVPYPVPFVTQEKTLYPEEPEPKVVEKRKRKGKDKSDLQPSLFD